jgi:hypothetical protein
MSKHIYFLKETFNFSRRLVIIVESRDEISHP